MVPSVLFWGAPDCEELGINGITSEADGNTCPKTADPNTT